MASHYGRDSTYNKISARFFWYSIYNDVAEFVKTCVPCQKQGSLTLNTKTELHSIPVPTAVMNQIGTDICNLPEVDGFCCLVVCIDYFSKLSEAKPLKDKSVVSVSQFLYELICRHGCFSIQINDQVREFVNGVSAELHRLTGTNQLVTSAYHPQANGLVERQNRTIKNSLIKVLDSNPTDWPYVIEGVLFDHRVSKHASTKYSPFELLCNRKAVLPIDIKHNTNDLSNLDEPFDKAMFDTVLESATSLRNNIHHNVEANIKKAQKKH